MGFYEAVSSLRGMLPRASAKYTALPTSRSRSHSHQQPAYPERIQEFSERHRKFFKMFMGSTLLILVLYMTMTFGYVLCAPVRDDLAN